MLKIFVKKEPSRFLCCNGKHHPGFQYHDLVLTNAKLIFEKMESHRFLCQYPPAGGKAGFHIIDSDLRERVDLSVKKEPHRFLCRYIRCNAGFHIIDSNLHGCVDYFVKKEPHRFLCLPTLAGIRFPYY
jgi:hypothetical protein